MDLRKLISDKFEVVSKEYSLAESSDFYNNTFTYEEYLATESYSEDEKINLYIKYMAKSTLILKHIKTELEKIPNYEDKLVDKKILGAHIKAILDAKNVDISNERAVEKFGFYYGWLDTTACANNESLYTIGKSVLDKLKYFKLNDFQEDTDRLSQLAKYYDWRKLIWMRLSMLIKGVDKEKIANLVNSIDVNDYDL